MQIRHFLLMVWVPTVIWAHKITVFAVVEGNRIYIQSYASDGAKIKGGTIEVYDRSGNKLLSGQTDTLGEFSFIIPKKDDLRIVLIGGMGHRAETIISAEELPEIEEKIIVEPKKKEPHKESPRVEITGVDTTLLKRIVEDAMDARLHLLMRVIAEGKRERLSFNEVLGGIGYIVGIVGIVAFFMSRKKSV